MTSQFFNSSGFYLLPFSTLLSAFMLMHMVQVLHWTQKTLILFQAFVSLVLPPQHLNMPQILTNITLQHICAGWEYYYLHNVIATAHKHWSTRRERAKMSEWKLPAKAKSETCGSFPMRSISPALSSLKAQAQLTFSSQHFCVSGPRCLLLSTQNMRPSTQEGGNSKMMSSCLHVGRGKELIMPRQSKFWHLLTF